MLRAKAIGLRTLAGLLALAVAPAFAQQTVAPQGSSPAQDAPVPPGGVTARLKQVADQLCRTIPRYDVRHAGEDARAEARHGHHYLLDDGGEGGDVPGVHENHRGGYPLPVRAMPGPGWVYCGKRSDRQRAYALRFNRAMMGARRRGG